MSLIRPSMDKVWNFNTLWPSIEPLLIKLFKEEPIQPNDWHNLFLYVHRLCLWDRTGPDLLMISIEKHTKKFVKQICNRIIVHNNNIALLKAYVREWKTYYFQCDYLPVPFKEMEMAIVGKSITLNNLHHNDVRVDMTKKMMMSCWYKLIFNGIKERLQSAAMELLNNERNGDVFSMRYIMAIKESFVQLYTDDEDSLKTYKECFEQPYFETTDSFYKLKAAQYLKKNGFQKYLTYAETKLTEEKIRAVRYLKTPQDVLNMNNTCIKLLISNFQSIISYECQNMIRRNDITQLRGLYKIMKTMPNGTTTMEDDFEGFIVDTGLADIELPANTQNTEKYVTQLLVLFHRFSNLVHEAFDDDPRFLTARDKAFSKIVNTELVSQTELATVENNSHEMFYSESKCPEILAYYCDMLLRKTTLSKRLTIHEIENKLKDIMLVLEYVENVDIFMRYHTAHLSRRLILETSIDFETDENMIKNFNAFCIYYEAVHRLTRMFQDTRINHDLSNEFNNLCTVKDKSTGTVSIKILNSHVWKMMSEYVNVSLPIELEDHVSQIEQFYKNKHKGRKLLWCHHMSSSTITFSSDVGTFDVDITTFQMVVLFIWNQRPNDKITFENLKLATELPDIELRKTLWSLVASEGLKKQILLVSSKVSTPKEFNDNTTFWINRQFCLVKDGMNQNQGKVNLIGKLQLYIEQNEEDRQSIIKLRKFRVQEGIIKILKMRQKITKTNLEKEVIEILNNMFMPSKKMIKEQIEWLIDQNFIKRDDNDINVFVYIS